MTTPEPYQSSDVRRENYIWGLLMSLGNANYNNTLSEEGKQGFHFWKMVRITAMLLAAGVGGAKISGFLD